MTKRGRIIVAGVGWHPEDLMHRLSRQPGWHSARFPVEKEDGSPWWPERWSRERIAAKRIELGPAECARQLDCLARSDAESRFKMAWLEMALQRGSGKRMMETLFSLPPGHRVVHGVDLAVSKKLTGGPIGDRKRADLSRRFPPIDRAALGRWSGPEILANIANVWKRYSGTVCVESVACQALVSHFLRESDLAIPTADFATGRAKMSIEFQAEILATELSNGKWILPSDDGRVNHWEVSALCRDLLYYSPSAHCPDRLASLLFARWAAETGAHEVVSFRLDLMSR